MPEQLFYVGCYTSEDRGGRGISLCSLDLETGALSLRREFPGLVNPTYLCLDWPRRRLFAVRSCKSAEAPSLLMFAIDPESAELSLIDEALIDGEGPCHVAVNGAGTLAVAANYPSGSVSAFELTSDGKFGKSRTIEHEGSGPNPRRQEGPHAHCILFTDETTFLATDLGADRLVRYDARGGVENLAIKGEPLRTVPGAGPRHVTVTADGSHLFAVNELGCTVDIFCDDRIVASASTLPADFSGTNTCAAIHLSNDERFVYASNRGHDTIAIFPWDRATGTLEPRGNHSTAGTGPRDFSLNPDGTWLVAANQTSHSLVSFKRDVVAGTFSEPIAKLESGAPVCVKFVPA